MSNGRSIKLARSYQRAGTRAEAMLWEQLRGRRLAGLKFRRQHPLGGFIGDFYCADRGLVVELDGSVHRDREQKEYDGFRETELARRGLVVLRFSNDEVETALPDVLARIGKAAEQARRASSLEPTERSLSADTELPTPRRSEENHVADRKLPSPRPSVERGWG